MPRPRIVLVALIVATAGLASCGDAAAEQTSTTTTTTRPTTTTTRPTTTTTRATTTTTEAGTPAPLNGLPVEDEDLLERRALVVKIDNFPDARPQSGLSAADAVIELSVEGITRFAAIFHTEDSEEVGPIRSVRPTDWQIAKLVGGPLVISGGQDWVQSVISRNGVGMIGEVGPPQTFRSSARRRPHNLYGDTLALRDLADSRGYPDEPPQPIWELGPLPEGGEEATEITLPFTPDLRATWTFDDGEYLRETNGVVHEWIDGEGERSQISADVLVVLQMETYNMQPPPGGGVARAVDSVGEGRAWVFAGGEVVEGSWSRPAADEPFSLETEDGETLTVPPGKPWISFFPDGRDVSWS